MNCIGAILCGTLVVIVPTKDGLVVAADSRVGNEYHNRHCDEDYKLIELGGSTPRTIATITGVSAIREPSNDPDFCHHLRVAPTWLDLRDILKTYIEEQRKSAVDLSISAIQSTLEQAFTKIPPAGRDALKPYAGRQISLLATASYDPISATSWVRYASLFLSDDLKPLVSAESVDRLDLTHDMMFYRLGEKDYADRLFDARALKFSRTDTFSFLATPKKIGDVDREGATHAAIDFIEAVSAATKIIVPPSGIGGPVDVLFLGRSIRPERVQWK